ncbi:prolyl-tRNA synthetase [Gregarina niphandrodes]|uniref:proline--tRNA ligase n=1 Tax=Gregarina niphandrodes TaxID=110365 RepID=A0A023B5T4_GRENI|nr:prolyl-tRNA synthetase [Gregarina niphandrodes]EZG62789.1 prolyl-tRNA synthetase [Gregarina niphandrodes]|eukprot:XP_011130710.1 prolyl-tRNA synthetase [Gregarina niphandrodes]
MEKETDARHMTTTSAEEKSGSPQSQGKQKKPKAEKPKAEKSKAEKPKGAASGTAQLGITVDKLENFPQWYTEVITKAELIEYYDVSGCYILRPWIYNVWECVQGYLNNVYRVNGVKNSYFPMFVTKSKLEAEEDHVEGFSAEVAWVTKSGSSDLPEPIAIRPTSETIMYPAFQKWIRSHRDLPLKLNQWCPVVRWEFSHPTPFIRTREFLWQEGHTAHATGEEADAFAKAMLYAYQQVYRNVYAIPVIPGQKSEMEKFAGGFKTYTTEVYVGCNGRSIQAATSHNLGQNFAKIFGVEYEDDTKTRHHVHQTSFGLSTRSIGAMIMVHGDKKGLVLPPRCAPVHVVVVPIVKKDMDVTVLYETCRRLTNEISLQYLEYEEPELCHTNLVDQKQVDLLSKAQKLSKLPITVEFDDRECYNPGWKYNHWEVKGVPLRLEVGPRDIEQGTCRLVRRCDGQKFDIQQTDAAFKVVEELNHAHTIMFNAAKNTQDQNIQRIQTYDQVMPALDKKQLVLAPWCQRTECEKDVKTKTGKTTVTDQTTAASGLSGSMKTLCMPFEQPHLEPDTSCFNCNEKATIYCLWGRSY